MSRDRGWPWLDAAGLLLLAVAAGLVALPLGVAVAGVGCLVMSWRMQPEQSEQGPDRPGSRPKRRK